MWGQEDKHNEAGKRHLPAILILHTQARKEFPRGTLGGLQKYHLVYSDCKVNTHWLIWLSDWGTNCPIIIRELFQSRTFHLNVNVNNVSFNYFC